jgi:hypothetical protein
MLHRATVQVPGRALRLTAEFFREEFKRRSSLQSGCLAASATGIGASLTMCFVQQLHSVEERLSRWLLMIHDRCRVISWN